MHLKTKKLFLRQLEKCNVNSAKNFFTTVKNTERSNYVIHDTEILQIKKLIFMASIQFLLFYITGDILTKNKNLKKKIQITQLFF